MSAVEADIEKAFRELVGERRYRSITVKDICERADVSRKTFYSYFNDKDSLLERIIRRDMIKPMRDICSLLSNDEVLGLARSIYERMYKAVYDDGEFYRALLVPMRRTDFTFLYIASSALYDFHRDTLSRLSLSVATPRGDFIASYFAQAQAMMIDKWVCDGFQLTPSQIASLYEEVALPFWKKLAAKVPELS